MQPRQGTWQSPRYETMAPILHDPCICNRCRFQAFALHAFSHLCTRLLPGFAGAIRGMRRLAYHCGNRRAVGHQVRPGFRARARVRPPVLGRAHRRQRSAAGGGPSDCPAEAVLYENWPLERGPAHWLAPLSRPTAVVLAATSACIRLDIGIERPSKMRCLQHLATMSLRLAGVDSW